MKKRKSEVNIAITLSISYLLMLMLPTIAALAIYFEYEKTLNEHTHLFNDYVTSTMAHHIENVLVDIRKLYSSIAVNPRTGNIAAISDMDSYFNSKETYLFQQDLKTYNFYKSNVSFFYVYFDKTDSVFFETGLLESKYFYDIYLSAGNATYEEWKKTMTDKNPRNYYPHTISRSDKSHNGTAFIMSTPELPGVTISVVADNDTFFQGIYDSKWSSLCDVFLFDSRGDLITSNAGRVTKELPKKISEIKESGNVVIRNHIAFDTVNMTFVAIAPLYETIEHIVNMKLFSIVLLVICITAAIIFSWHFTRMHCRPVRDVLSILGAPIKGNEYSKIRQSAERIMSENKSLISTAEKQREALRLYALGRIIKDSYLGGFDDKLFLKYGINFNAGIFAIVGFYIDDLNELFKDDPNLTTYKKFADMQFIVTNIFEEILNSKDSAAYVVDIDGMLFCAVNVHESEARPLDFIIEKCDYGLDIINTNFSVSLTYSLSDIHTKAQNLPTAYSEAMQAIEYKNMMNITRPLLYNEIKKETKSEYIFTTEREQKLINCVRVADFEGAENVIDDIFQRLKSDQNISLEYTKCLMFDIAASIMKIPCEIHTAKFEANKILLYCTTLSSMKEYITDAVREMCEKMTVGQKKLNFQERIIEFISENYKNPNLNIDFIGDYFETSPSYISKIFKDSYGETLVDFINKYRLTKAKELIKSEKYTFIEITEMVGYNHVRTFNRIFKKYEGITPSVFKEKY